MYKSVLTYWMYTKKPCPSVLNVYICIMCLCTYFFMIQIFKIQWNKVTVRMRVHQKSTYSHTWMPIYLYTVLFYLTRQINVMKLHSTLFIMENWSYKVLVTPFQRYTITCSSDTFTKIGLCNIYKIIELRNPYMVYAMYIKL